MNGPDWIPWTGSENPVPGTPVQIKVDTDPDHAYDAHSDDVEWDNTKRRFGPRLLAYRVAPAWWRACPLYHPSIREGRSMTDTVNPFTPHLISRLCAEVFADNVTAGWYTCIETGESLVGKRNVGELLMLVTTEIAEAADGWDGGLHDDKLPHRMMFEVELADTAIRVFDLGGGLSLDLGSAAATLQAAGVRGTVSGAGTPFNLLLLVRHVSRAMEAHRKGNRSGIEQHLSVLLLGIGEMATDAGCDLLEAIAEKRAFNQTRADHRVENRRKAGGKSC